MKMYDNVGIIELPINNEPPIPNIEINNPESHKEIYGKNLKAESPWPKNGSIGKKFPREISAANGSHVA